ncbi:MAG: ATP-binding protein [Campylobacterales bacterium]
MIVWLTLSCLLAAGFGLNIWLSHRQKLAEAATLTGNLAYTYATLTDHLMGDLDRFMTRAMHHWMQRKISMNAFQSLLDVQKEALPHAMDLLILNAQGEIMLWTGSGTPPDVRDRDYFRFHAQNPGSTIYIGKPQPSKVHAGRWFFSLSRAFRTAQGELEGVAVAIIDREALQREYATLLNTPEVSVGLLYGPQGRFIIRAPDAGAEVIGQSAPSVKNLTLPLQAPKTVILPEAVDGFKRFATLRSLENYPDLSVASTVRMDYVLKSWLPSALQLGLFWLLISLAGWLFSNRLIRLQLEKNEAADRHKIALEQSETRFRLAAEKTGQLIYEYRPQTQTIIWAGAIEGLTGYTPEAFARFGPSEREALIHPDDCDRAMAIWEQAQTFNGSMDMEYRMQRRDGSYFDAEEHGAFFETQGGEWRMIGAISDISKRKEFERAQEALSRTLEERVYYEVGKRMELEDKKREQEKLLIQQSKMAAMGEMIGAIAHQWRQPLNSLGLYVQDIEDAWRHGELNDGYLHETIEKSMRQIRFMSQTINDFRNFFKPDKFERVFDLRSVVEHSLSLVGAQLQAHNIDLIADLSDAPAVVKGYENELGQALLNLLSNAKDALDTHRETGRRIHISLSLQEAWAVLCVEDNGGGIPEHLLERIFEPYFSTKEEGKGSGIGLYMAKMIVEQNMRGAINAENTGEGARLCIRLPLEAA